MHAYTAMTSAPQTKTIIHIKILQSANEKYRTVMAPIQLLWFLLKLSQFQKKPSQFQNITGVSV